MRTYELDSLWSLAKQTWLVSRWEKERFSKMLKKWKQENPTPTLIQQMIIESLIRLHIWEARLLDRRIHFDGCPTDYKQSADHCVEIDGEDLADKRRDFDKYMPQVMRWKSDLLKIALANNVSLSITGDADSVSSLFGALDKKDQELLEKQQDLNGDSSKET